MSSDIKIITLEKPIFSEAELTHISCELCQYIKSEIVEDLGAGYAQSLTYCTWNLWIFILKKMLFVKIRYDISLSVSQHFTNFYYPVWHIFVVGGSKKKYD